MKHIRFTFLAIAILLLAGLACGPQESTPSPEAIEPTVEQLEDPTSEPATAIPTPTPEPQGSSIEISNESGTDVYYIYLSPSQADKWGDDWLQGQVIRNGATITIHGVPNGLYDVKAEDQNGDLIEVFWQVDIQGDMTWSIKGLASLEVINESADTITDLYVSPVESDTWGDNWLSTEVIGSGESMTVGGITPGVYDVKAATSTGDTTEVIYGVEISGQKTWLVEGMTGLPANAVLRFEDEFSDNRNNWGLDADTGDVLYSSPSDGQYCIEIRSPNYTAWEWYEPFRPDEFVAEVLCYVDGPADATCGLGFGPDGDNLYWFEVSGPEQSFALFLLEDDAWQDPLIEWTQSVNIDPDGTNFLSMERVQGSLYLYINGVQVGQIESDRFPSGRIGIGGSTYDEGGAIVCLDDLRVWRLE
jgi:hypothetical protein